MGKIADDVLQKIRASEHLQYSASRLHQWVAKCQFLLSLVPYVAADTGDNMAGLQVALSGKERATAVGESTQDKIFRVSKAAGELLQRASPDFTL